MLLIVNVNVSKMVFAPKKQVRLNREGGIYGNSRRHSQLLRGYISDLHHAHIKDLVFLVVLRPRLRKRAAEARIKTSAISIC